MIIYSSKEMGALAKKVAKAVKAEYGEIIYNKFPDGDDYVKLGKNPKGKIMVIVESFAFNPDEKIMKSILACSVGRDYGAKKIILVGTYLPYMRQDKRFNELEAVSARVAVPLLSMMFDKTITIDPHLHRIKKMEEVIHNAHAVTANTLVAAYVAKNFKDYKIVGPDEESQQWDSLIAKTLHRDATILKKERLSSYHVKIKSKKLGEKVLIIDDIISTGKTILETIKIAKKHGAKKIACIGIHGIFAGNCDKEIKKYAELVTTNTIPGKYAKIDVSPLISEALKKQLKDKL